MNKLVCSVVLALAAQMTVAEDVTLTSFKTIPQYFGLNSEVWKTASDVTTSWASYNDGTTIAHIKHVGGSASSSFCSDTMNYGGLVIDLSSRTTWSLIEQTNNKMTLGATGVDVKSGRYFLGARNSACIELTANQTWTGSHATGNTYFNIGDISGQMPNTPLVAADGVTSLTIGGRLQAAIYGHNNQLSAVTVMVKDSAMLRLPDTADARLGAAKLVLADAGNRMTFGSPAEEKAWYYPSDSAWKPVDIVAIDHDHLAPVVELKDGAGFSAENGLYGLTNLCVSGTATSTVSGSLTLTQALTRVTFLNAGASLVLATANGVAGVDGCTLEAVGPGTLSVTDAHAFTHIDVAEGATVSVGGSNLRMTLSGAGTISVPPDTYLYVRPSDMADFTGSFVVDGGALVLDAELPAGRVTVLSGSVLYGSGNGVVTDVVRTEAELTVGKGEVLRVFGNGLTAATALKLNAGTLRFEGPATVASPVTITMDTSYIETAALSVTGSITGAILSDIPTDGRATVAGIGTATRGPGCLKLSGGGTWNKYRPNSFLTLDGSVWFCGGEYLFRNTSCGIYYSAKTTGTWGRHWLVTDGAKLKVVGYNDAYSTDLRVSGLEHPTVKSYISILEVRDGGDVEIAENAHISLGYLQANGHLLVGDGGTVRVTKTSGNIRFGYSTTTTGVIDLRAGGMIETASPFMHSIQANNQTYQTQGHFLWNGGTVKVRSEFPANEASLFRNHRLAKEEWTDVNGSLRVWMKIMGETCTLDLTDLPERETPLANVPAGLERSEWFGTGTLTVKGGKPFVFQSFPNGINLKVDGAGTQVILPTNVEIHDYETCLKTEDVNAGGLQYTTLDKCLQNLALASFTAEGAAGSFVCLKPDCKVTIAEARAAAGGEFVNGMLSAVGGLEVGDLTFAENAIVCGDPAAAAFVVTGDITLPDALRYAVRKTKGYPTTFTAFTAGGSLAGNPTTLTPEPGMNSRQVVIDPAAKAIGFAANGLILMVR